MTVVPSVDTASESGIEEREKAGRDRPVGGIRSAREERPKRTEPGAYEPDSLPWDCLLSRYSWYSSPETTVTFPSMFEWPTPQYSAQ